MKRLFLLLILIACYAQAAKPAPTINEPLKIWNRQTNGRTAFTDGMVLDPGTYAVQVEVNPQTQSVRIVVDNQAQPPENSSPYTGPDFTVDSGNHVVVATPYSGDNASGTKGASVTVNFIVSGATPTPTPTVPPSPTPTPTATASPTPSPSPTPTPTPTPTATPSPSPTPTPAGPLVTVTVLWDATLDNSYTIFYGKDPTCPMQVDGGTAFQDGPMCVAIANLEADTLYYFSSGVTVNGVRSPKLDPPVQYTTSSAPNQQVELKKK